MSAPTDAQIETAIRCLEVTAQRYGPEQERSECIAVIVYLEGLLERRQAREAGCTVQYLRKLKSEGCNS